MQKSLWAYLPTSGLSEVSPLVQLIKSCFSNTRIPFLSSSSWFPHRPQRVAINDLGVCTDRNDSFASLPMIPLPPFLPSSMCLVLCTFRGAQGQTEHGAEQLIKRRRGSIWTWSLNLFPELSLAFVCLGSIILLINIPVRDLGSTRDAFKASVLPAGVYSLCCSGHGLLLKRKGNWTGENVFPCSSRMQGAPPVTFDWSLALIMWHLGKLCRLLATPASQGYECPEAPLFFPTYQWVS